jgi:predicted ATPase/DNA-binding CsgD family transcriptional regulator
MFRGATEDELMVDTSVVDPNRISPVPRLPAPTPIRVPRWAGFPAAPLPPIGRDRDVATLRDHLREPRRRLVTITGPGGVGKTRLALAVAEEVAADYADGAAFVALADLTEPTMILPAIARVLDARETAGRSPRETVIEALRERHLLLVLDNFEHLASMTAVADLSALFTACPELTMLVTSRTPVGLHDERLFVTPTLGLPAVADIADPESLAAYGAIALFVDRARLVNPAFVLTAENAPAVVEICRRLDGLPLAIELAAAWVRALPPKALLARLEPRLPLLRGGAEDQPRRLRDMRDTIAWSYDLLNQEEQQFFRNLGGFVGGFSFEGAERVHGGGRRETGGGSGEALNVVGSPAHSQLSEVRLLTSDSRPPTSDSVLDLLARLIDKSLLRQAAHDGAEPRYQMLETVREFALERLAERGEAREIASAHAAYYLDLAEQADPELMDTEQAVWFDRLEAEHPNLLAALLWFLTRGDAERGLRLASALTWFWSSRSYFHEARRWLEAFLSLPTSSRARARGLLDAANILNWQEDNERAAAYAEEALAICRTDGEQELAGYALRRLGSIAIDLGDFDRAAPLLAESETLLRSFGAPWDIAYAPYIAGRLAVAAGKSDEAVGHFARAAEAFQGIGDRGYVAAALGRLGAAAIAIDDLPTARNAFAESLDLARAVKDQSWVAWALAGAAHVAHAAGEHTTAARLLGAATAIGEAIGEPGLPRTTLTDVVRSSLGADTFAREWSRGEQLPEADAVVEALAILTADPCRSRAPASTRGVQPLTLSERERQVLALLIDGRSDQQIAGALFISRRTASNHVSSILRKLDVGTRAEAAVRAVRDGLV